VPAFAQAMSGAVGERINSTINPQMDATKNPKANR